MLMGFSDSIGRSAMLELASIKAKYANVILVHAHPGWKKSMSWHRRFKIVKQIHYQKLAVVPRHFHDYDRLMLCFRGAIIRILRMKDRPAVIRRHLSRKDRLINKRKTYLRSL
jgi:hypothetical protein